MFLCFTVFGYRMHLRFAVVSFPFIFSVFFLRASALLCCALFFVFCFSGFGGIFCFSLRFCLCCLPWCVLPHTILLLFGIGSSFSSCGIFFCWIWRQTGFLGMFWLFTVFCLPYSLSLCWGFSAFDFPRVFSSSFCFSCLGLCFFYFVLFGFGGIFFSFPPFFFSGLPWCVLLLHTILLHTEFLCFFLQTQILLPLHS